MTRRRMDGETVARESTGDETGAGETAPDGATEPELGSVRERAASIRAEEVSRARSRLRARGDLSPDERAVVETLADRLVERLLVVPARRLAAANEIDAAAGTVRDLFED